MRAPSMLPFGGDVMSGGPEKRFPIWTALALLVAWLGVIVLWLIFARL